MRGDELDIRKALREDARGLRNPVYFRFILTVDNPAAERFRRLDGTFCDRVLRDAVEKTFRGAAQGAQGVFAIHQHGGQGRPAHPHVHALLSPRFENRMAVHLSPVRIQRIRERWETEVLRGLQRQERRLDRARQGLAPIPIPRWRERDAERTYSLLPVRKAPRLDGQLESRWRGAHWRLREATPGWHGRSASAGAASGGRTTRNEPLVARCSAWPREQCRRGCGRSCGSYAACEASAFGSGRGQSARIAGPPS